MNRKIKTAIFIILLPTVIFGEGIFLYNTVQVYALDGSRAFLNLDDRRIEVIASMLSKEPAGFGRPYTDRAAWDAPQLRQKFGGVISEAEKLLSQELPAWDDNLYLEYSQNGKRAGGEAMLNRRAAWLYPLVAAECLENKGRFVPAINRVLSAYAAERTWQLPAHDRGLLSYSRQSYEVELRSGAFGYELAEALYLLGDKIQPEVRRRVMRALEERIFGPVRESLKSGTGNAWLKMRHNWNAVCIACVTGAALTVLPDVHERAEFVAAAEYYIHNYLSGYADDGYCVEGLSYWNFGFGAFTVLREQLVKATGGKIDLFSDMRVRNIALYGINIQMTDSNSPAFADCRFGAKPDKRIISYCNQALKLGLDGYERPSDIRKGYITSACLDAFPIFERGGADGVGQAHYAGLLRSYFEQAGVLVSRPLPGSSCRLGVAIKGDGNGNHSHNDIGSFTIALGKEQPVGDPGGPKVYDKSVFDSRRYSLKTINSFGHPVPVVCGKLQKQAVEAFPMVVKTDFTEQEDVIAIDIASAYEAPELRKLVRTLRYNRTGAGSVIVYDEFVFSNPSIFESALITRGSWQRMDNRTLEFVSGQERLVAEIEAPGDFTLVEEKIRESGQSFLRVGIRMNEPLISGTLKIKFRPR